MGLIHRRDSRELMKRTKTEPQATSVTQGAEVPGGWDAVSGHFSPEHHEPQTPTTAAIVLRAEPWTATDGSESRTGWKVPRVRLESRPVPAPGVGELSIRMLRLGICGTDIHLLETNSDGQIRCTSPFSIPTQGRVIGHEGLGIVEQVGPGLAGWQPGDFASLESIVTCGDCPACRRGHFNQCTQAALVGLQRDGLFCERVVVPARLAHQVNDLAGSPAERDGLACVEPAAVAFLACQQARLTPGDHVLVLGGGPIGYLAALLARQVFGAATVCLSEPQAFRRELARQACDRVVTPEELDRGTESFDVVIEAAGALSVIDTLLPRLRPNSRIVLLARTGTPLAITRVDEIITKAITLCGSRGHLGGAFGAVLELMRRGRLDLRQVVTRVVSGLDGLATALRDPGQIVRAECKVVADLESGETQR